jgi:CRP-like cAMP-binding protein
LYKTRSNLDPKLLLAKLDGGWTAERYNSGEPIYVQGDTANAVYYLRAGAAKITVVSKNGKEAVPGIYVRGEFFGESCIIGETRRSATVTAITDCAALRLEASAMLNALRLEPKLAELFINHLIHRNCVAQDTLVDQLVNNSEKRLARILLLLANTSEQDTPVPVLATFKQETLAEMVGTTRARVSHFLNKFRRQGYIDYHGGNILIEPAKLARVLQDAHES